MRQATVLDLHTFGFYDFFGSLESFESEEVE